MAKQTKKEEGKGTEKPGISLETIKQAVKSARELLGAGWNEMRFNRQIDKMQLAIAENKYAADKRAQRAEKLLADIEEEENRFRGATDEDGNPLKSLANWKPLADYFNKTLAHMTENSFKLDASVKASNFVRLAGLQKVTDEQRKVITTFFDNKAMASFERVNMIRVVLDKKGLLKREKPQLPTEKEIAQTMTA